MDIVFRLEGLFGLLTRPEGIPIVLMVAAISALAVASLRSAPVAPSDEPEG